MDKQNILRISNLDSTNNYVLSLKGKKAFKEGLVIVSDYQTNGRGQRGNYWESEKGKNLIFSILIEPNFSIEKQFDINKIVSSSLVDVLSKLGLKSKIKWPNDILIGRKKIAGILIQNVICKNIITHSVIGIGLNVNQLSFNNYIPKATSLRLETDKNFNLEEIQNEVLGSMQNRVQDYRSGKDLNDKYLHSLFQKDKVAVFESKYQKFNGIIKGVTARGLLVLDSENIVKEFNSEEIKMLF